MEHISYPDGYRITPTVEGRYSPRGLAISVLFVVGLVTAMTAPTVLFGVVLGVVGLKVAGRIQERGREAVPASGASRTDSTRHHVA